MGMMDWFTRSSRSFERFEIGHKTIEVTSDLNNLLSEMTEFQINKLYPSNEDLIKQIKSKYDSINKTSDIKSHQ